MKRSLKRISLVFVVMAVTISMCSLTTVFADDGSQISISNNEQSVDVSTNEIQPRIGLYPVYYRVINVKALASEWVNVGTADGIPSMTLTINKSKTTYVTYSATFGATYGQINAAVGWTYGEAVIISIGGDYKVPTTYNGHKIKSGTLIAYAERSVKSYQVEKHNEYGGITLSTGTARKTVNHMRYKVILYYTDGGSVTISV